jgi:Uri superfamily endonuclease
MQTFMAAEFPCLPGSYALFLTLDKTAELSIGKLGGFVFPAGEYFYTGSAHGAGGLCARLRHHLRSAQRPHWHIDWLRTKAVVVGGVYVVQGEGMEGGIPLECVWSQALLELPGASAPVRGFGASDCHSGCEAHLVFFVQPQDLLKPFMQFARSKVVLWTAS